MSKNNFDKFKKSIINNAYSNLISGFKETGNYNEDIFKSSLQEIENYLVREVFQEKWKNDIIYQPDKKSFSLDHLKLELYSWRKENPLVLPIPEFKAELSGMKLGITAILGGLFGIIFFFLLCLIINIFSIALLSDNLYLVAYSVIVPLASGFSVWFVWSCSYSSKIRKLVMSFLGLSAFFEVVCLVNSAKSLFSIFRTRNRSFLFFLRIPFYLLVVFILKNTVKKPSFDNTEYKELVTIVLNIWVNMLVLTANQIIMQADHGFNITEQSPLNIGKLLGYVYKLYYSDSSDLPVVASEIISFLKTQGFEGFDQQPLFIQESCNIKNEFIWDIKFEKEYEAVGVIEEGDKVFAESIPVIKNGKVISKGIVRKVRTL